uniref:hypothetical protein n=1 Tax=Streptomyces sp. NBC_01562 TaxID=2975879 RepID=UPI002F91765A
MVAVVLLVTSSGGSGTLAGVLGACITAPHLLGPFVARPLDLARGGRKVIAAACLLHATALATGALAYGHAPAVLTALLLAGRRLRAFADRRYQQPTARHRRTATAHAARGPGLGRGHLRHRRHRRPVPGGRPVGLGLAHCGGSRLTCWCGGCGA